MDQAKADILIHLARQAIYCVDRGQMIVTLIDIDRWDRPGILDLYKSLHKSKYIRKKKVLGCWTYQLSKRGWNRLTEGQKQDMLDEYIEWKERIKPTIAGPEWLEWIE